MVAQTVEPITRDAVADRLAYARRGMPTGLTRFERDDYDRGFSAGLTFYARKHGGPGIVHDGAAPAAGTAARRALGIELAERGRAWREEAFTTAHRRGMSALRKGQRSRGLEESADPLAARTARRRPRKSAPVENVPAPVETAPEVPPVDETPAPEAVAPVVRLVPALEPEQDQTPEAPADETETPRANRTRKLARRQLAEQMRARGDDPRDPDAWAAAKLAAGVK